MWQSCNCNLKFLQTVATAMLAIKRLHMLATKLAELQKNCTTPVAVHVVRQSQQPKQGFTSIVIKVIQSKALHATPQWHQTTQQALAPCMAFCTSRGLFRGDRGALHLVVIPICQSWHCLYQLLCILHLGDVLNDMQNQAACAMAVGHEQHAIAMPHTHNWLFSCKL